MRNERILSILESAAVAAVLGFALSVLFSWLLTGCGPSHAPPPYKLKIVLDSTGDVAEVATVCWAKDGVWQGSVPVTMPAHGSVEVKIPGDFPDLLCFETLAWGERPWAGLYFNQNEFSGALVVHVRYPQGDLRREFEKK